MALSLSSRRQAQTSAATWSGQQEAGQARSSHLRLQKQHSFAEASRANVGTASSRNGRAAHLTRGLSVDRSYESFRQRILTPKANLADQRLRRTTAKLRDSTYTALRKSSIDGAHSYVLTGATSTLLKSLDGKLKEVNKALNGRTNALSCAAADSRNKGSDIASQPQQPHLAQTASSKEEPKSDVRKINLNIVLAHAIKTSTENEACNSEIESCSEASDNIIIPASRPELSTKPNVAAVATAQQRRAQFRSSRSTTINASSSALPPPPPQVESPAANANANTNTNGAFSASPSLIVQRRPPLVRAMSAPVRSRPLDDNCKGAFALNKRKLRRRKLLPRNASVCDNSESTAEDSRSDLILDIGGSRKKTPLARARSTIAVDVITLVSLVSSEGSDSEKEDSASAGHSEPNSGRPSSLRKTGKSATVSFQENYPPNFQLATKEYSHMIRRGSIAPLSARLRANRTPTAPLSMFLNDSTDIDAMTTPTGQKASNSTSQPAEGKDNAQSDKENTGAGLATKPEECIFPEYVRSIKERECWKLYRKMSLKGVSVTYDTILRGMLTPTEFRQVQKQREFEEAKARALEEEKLAAEIPPPRTTALDRITQAHIKK